MINYLTRELDFGTMVDYAIRLNLKLRREMEDLSDTLPLHLLAMEYWTVSIDVGRMSGKTFYINMRATREDLVITHLASSRIRSSATAMSATQLKHEKTPGIYRRVYIDEPGYVWKHISPEELYGKLARNGIDQVFIALGRSHL